MDENSPVTKTLQELLTARAQIDRAIKRIEAYAKYLDIEELTKEEEHGDRSSR